jgi:Holliday junction DNA helicase RuvB
MKFTMPVELAEGDYPTSWDGFIGQEKAKQQIKLAANSAKIRKQSMDHMLIASGTPGIGKTSLALLAARQMGTKITVTSGPITLEHALILLSGMKDGEILFIDEAHKLVDAGKKDAEWLLHYLQDGMLVGAYSYENVPKVTIIAATTEVGRLPATVVGRFPIRPQLVEYSEEEASLIAAKLARKVMGSHAEYPTVANCDAIAVAGNRNPRAIRQILVTLRDMAVTEMLPFDPKAGYDIAVVLDWHGISPDGLDKTAQRYLKILMDDFKGKAGQRAIEERLQEPGGRGEVERGRSE